MIYASVGINRMVTRNYKPVSSIFTSKTTISQGLFALALVCSALTNFSSTLADSTQTQPRPTYRLQYSFIADVTRLIKPKSPYNATSKLTFPIFGNNLFHESPSQLEPFRLLYFLLQLMEHFLIYKKDFTSGFPSESTVNDSRVLGYLLISYKIR